MSNQHWRPESPQSWQRNEPLEVSVARVQEGLYHVSDKVSASTERLHLLASRVQTLDGRVSLVEMEMKTISEAKPIIEQYKRREYRKQIIKDLRNWISIPLMLILAIFGKVPWDAVWSALGKMLGVG